MGPGESLARVSIQGWGDARYIIERESGASPRTLVRSKKREAADCSWHHCCVRRDSLVPALRCQGAVVVNSTLGAPGATDADGPNFELQEFQAVAGETLHPGLLG